MIISFATFNGANVLNRVLDGYCRMHKDGIEWKLIIINNGSTDKTVEIISSYKDRLPIILLEEPSPGKSKALNAGIPHFTDEFIVLTDDDAIPSPNFLIEWEKTSKDHLEYSLFAGTVDLIFDALPAQWLLDSRLQFGPLYAENRQKDGPIRASQIFGPNMAIRRCILDHHAFDNNIGPNSQDSQYPMGSETEFCVRAEKSGHKSWFSASPSVQHIVRENQIQPAFWRKRAYRHGRGMAQQNVKGIKKSAVKMFLSAAKYHTLQFLRRLCYLHPSPIVRFKSQWEYNWQKGFWDETRKRTRNI